MPPKHGKAAKGKKAADTQPVVAAPPPQVEEEDDVYREPIKRIVKPDDQVELTEKQLEEEITRVLTANDPNVPNNITK
jgi:dynein intermediate chain 1, axonemal